MDFMSDLRARLRNKVQLTTDGHKAYLSAVRELDFDADYAMMVKIYGTEHLGPGRVFDGGQIISTRMRNLCRCVVTTQREREPNAPPHQNNYLLYSVCFLDWVSALAF